MIFLDCAVFSSSSGSRLTLFTARAQGIQAVCGEHGFESLTFFVPLDLKRSFRLYDFPGILMARLWGGGATAWEGRIEDMQLVASGVSITALGYWRALSDLDKAYTALWSGTQLARWRPVTPDDSAVRNDAPYGFDKQNRLFITLDNGATYANGADTGAYIYEPPAAGLRQCVGASWDVTIALPTDWRFEVYAINAGFAGATNLFSYTSLGAAVSRSSNVTFAAQDQIFFEIFNLTGAPYTNAGEDGDYYVKVTNMRVVTTNTNRVNTTVAVGIAAGTRTVTPASMSNIYTGQRLTIDNGNAVSESVIVTAVTSTTFTAVFANAHGANFTVNALVVYADEIASHLVSQISALNSGQLSSSTALIASPQLDLFDVVYEDATPADILVDLAELGDRAATPNRWEVGVFEGQRLYFRIKGSAAQAWYVDAADVPNVIRTLTTLLNSVYGVYQEARGDRALRTSANTNSDSVTRYGITRRTSVKVDTTLLAEAQFVRDVALQDQKDIIPRASITVAAVYTASGARAPLWMVRSGDRVTIRNLPPSLSASIDKIRTFYIAELTYNVDNRTLELVPERPRPTLDFLLARQARGVD